MAELTLLEVLAHDALRRQQIFRDQYAFIFFFFQRMKAGLEIDSPQHLVSFMDQTIFF